MPGRIIIYPILLMLLYAYANQFIYVGCNASPARWKSSRVKADLRSMATAIESYYVDTDQYPSWSAVKVGAGKPKIPSFITEPDSHLGHLTTPISYVTSYFTDPFAQPKYPTYAYWQVDSHDAEGHEFNGWIAWSPGPDEDYDLTLKNIAQAYDPAARVPNNYLYQVTYDPTNGEKSNGDIYRTKQ